ncbi:MAG: DUF934 domain-containing protein [Pseudomonadota bacterium]|nr:DUF934 domain-containing protein [Pseudomonadota bacterium]
MILLHTDGSTETVAWRLLGEDDTPTGQGWEAIGLDHPSVESAGAPVGLYLDNTVDVEALPVDISRFGFIALDFPAFTDGRAYSQARVLRSRLNWTGPVVATGDLHQDQACYLRRCGIDVFAVEDETQAATLARGFNDFTTAYQATQAGEVPAYRRRSA